MRNGASFISIEPRPKAGGAELRRPPLYATPPFRVRNGGFFGLQIYVRTKVARKMTPMTHVATEIFLILPVKIETTI